MKPITLLLLAILSWLSPRPATADEGLTALAATARGAALNLAVRKAGLRNEDAQMNGLGVFISADGLALVDLSSIALPRKPSIVTADGMELPFGTILGIFPDQELALVKFSHRPKVWLSLATKEPELGEAIALIALSQPDLRSVIIPPVVGPVMAKRSGVPANIRVRRYVRILSLGAGLSIQQQASMGPGSFAINQQGQIAAIKNGIQMEGSQVLILLTPVAALADQVGKMVKEGKVIPFPLPEANNPIDLALLDAEFDLMHMALQKGDRASAQKLLGKLLERYPASARLKGLKGNSMLMSPDGASANAADFRPSDPKEPMAEQVNQLLGRAMFLANTRKDYEGAVRELRAALAICPPDDPQVRKTLFVMYLQLGRPEEAERFLREALASQPEAIGLVEALEGLLTRQGKFDEAQKMTERYYELGRIYRRR